MIRRRIRSKGDGSCEVRLPEEERELLRSLAAQVREVVGHDPATDEATARLFPTAYSEDTEREAEYRVLVGSELSDSLMGALDVLTETADRSRLEAAEADAWLRALNQVRLVVAIRLGITEEGTERPTDPSDSRIGAFATYDFLSGLQEELVDALATG